MLADLGLAQVPGGPSMRSQMSEAMPQPGTPAYMSPEQATPPFRHLAPASDVYALGAVLFEMLAGRLYKNVRPGTRVTKYRQDTPGWLVELLERMLAKEPEERPWDGAEAVELLRRSEASGQEAAEERARQEAEEKVRQEAEEKARREAKARAKEKEAARKRAEEERRRREQEEAERKRQEREAAEKARKEAEARAVQEREKAERERRALLRKLKVSEMVRVPAGEFMMGSPEGVGEGDEHPQHKVYLDTFEIGKYPVTNEQYAVFVADTGRTAPSYWQKGKVPKSKEKHPVVYVSWEDAAAYCQWLSEKTGEKWRLPTEAEWEKAARGTDGRTYPWGDEEPDKTRCNFGENVGGTTPVGRYPSGASPYGALDMAGNVWEWCADWYDEKYYDRALFRNPAGPANGQYRVLRGGSWLAKIRLLCSTYRVTGMPFNRSGDGGFRIANSS